MPISLKRLFLMRIVWTPKLERGISYGTVLDGVEYELQINQVASDAPFYTLVRGQESLSFNEAPDAWTVPVHPRNEGSS